MHHVKVDFFTQPLRGRVLILLVWIVFLINACRINDSATAASYLKVEGNTQLLTYSRVAIVLGDTMGNMIDTLYNDSVPSLSSLNRLPTENYQGGKAKLSINGYRKNILAYSEMRLYDGNSQSVLSLEILKSDNLASVANSKNLPASTPLGNPAVNLPANTSATTVTNLSPGPDPVAVAVFRTPSFFSFPNDTTVSIRDSVYLSSEVSDPDGDLAKFSWGCKMDGTVGNTVDTGVLLGFNQKIPYGKRFKIPGHYVCQLDIWDKGGRSARFANSIQVLLDPPKANAGPDTIVMVGTKLFLNASGEDNYDPIISRGWKIGEQPFKVVPQQETSIIAPATPQDLMCILTVMDADSLTAFDTLMVKVIVSVSDSLTNSANTLKK